MIPVHLFQVDRYRGLQYNTVALFILESRGLSILVTVFPKTLIPKDSRRMRRFRLNWRMESIAALEVGMVVSVEMS
jgi:hypothetical protein